MEWSVALYCLVLDCLKLDCIGFNCIEFCHIMYCTTLYSNNISTMHVCVCVVQVKELIDAMDQDLKKSAASSSALEAAAYQVCECLCV